MFRRRGPNSGNHNVGDNLEESEPSSKEDQGSDTSDNNHWLHCCKKLVFSSKYDHGVLEIWIWSDELRSFGPMFSNVVATLPTTNGFLDAMLMWTDELWQNKNGVTYKLARCAHARLFGPMYASFWPDVCSYIGPKRSIHRAKKSGMRTYKSLRKYLFCHHHDIFNIDQYENSLWKVHDSFGNPQRVRRLLVKQQYSNIRILCGMAVLRE